VSSVLTSRPEGHEPAGQGVALRKRHLPALDGLRAIAVGAVIVYHLGFGWAAGGYLGVDLFFVLSGFLITGLLVEERVSTGGISLPRFWARRARRLFPALLVVLGAVVVYAAAGGPNVDPPALRGDVLGTLFYVANWHFIATHNAYFAPFATPSPLEHTWSLAIEEQFYVVWPPLVLLVAKIGRRTWRRGAMAVTAALALASALEMALKAHGAADVSRAYFGTDTRVFELMVGAFLALWMEDLRQVSARVLRALHGAGVASLGLILAGFAALGGPPHWMFDGGFLAITILAAVVVASVAREEKGPLGAVLSLRPLQWIGKISYGLYLWHWPACVFVTAESVHLSGWEVDLIRVALTLGLATVSFYVVEQPIRQRRIPALSGTPGLAAAGGVAICIVLVLATVPATAATGGGAAGRDPGSGPKVTGAGGIRDQVPIALPEGLLIDRAHPLRVLIFGDSVMQLAELGIARSLESTGVVTVFQAAFPGFGLAPGVPLSPPSLPWHGALWFLDGLIGTLHPQLIIATWAEDSAAARAYPSAYRTMLDTTIRGLLNPDNGVAGVILLQMPLFGPIPQFLITAFQRELPFPGPPHAANLYQSLQLRTAGVPAWNKAVSQTPQRFPGRVMYFPVGSSLELNGHYTNWLPPTADPSAPHRSWVRVRMREAVHFCPPGITRYAAPVLEDLTELFHLPSAKRSWWASNSISKQVNPGWPLAKWCPNDHPRG
jgi:peptidoglycan/LPS O-acetylase OafA/YrhL